MKLKFADKKQKRKKQEREYYQKPPLNVKTFDNKGKKIQAELSSGKKVEVEIIGQVDYKRQLVKCGKRLYTISHDNKILREDYLQAHRAFVSKPKNQRNNTASGIKDVTYVKDNNGNVWYFDEKTGKAIVKGGYTKIVKQESAYIANQIHKAAKNDDAWYNALGTGIGTDNELLEKGIENIYSADILSGVNAELRNKDNDYDVDVDETKMMPVEALILDENNHKSARPLLKTLVNSGAMTVQEQARTIKREMEYELAGESGGILTQKKRALEHFEFGTSYTSTADLNDIMQMTSNREVRLEIENQYKNDPQFAGLEPNEGSYVRARIGADGGLMHWNDQEVDQFDANWVKTGAYQEARYVKQTDENGVEVLDANGQPVYILDEGDQAHRNAVADRLIFGYQDKEALNKGLDAINDDENSFDQQHFLESAQKEIEKDPEGKYQERFTNQDPRQRYIAGFHSDENGNVDSGEISASNTCLYKGLKPARIQAEETLYNAQKGDYSQTFDSMDTETYAAMAELVANGDVKGVKDMKDLYDKAYNSATDKNDKIKIKANAMISGQLKDNFTDEEITDFCLELMHSIDTNSGRGGSTNRSSGFTNIAEYQTEQLRAILQNNPQVIDAVKARVEQEKFTKKTSKSTTGGPGVVNVSVENTKDKYVQILAETKTIANEEVFLDANGKRITDKAQIDAIKQANMASLEEMRKYVAELEREYKKGVDAEGTLSGMANELSKDTGLGTDREDVATEYRNAKLMLQQFEAAAQGKLRDSKGNVISTQDLAKQMLEKQKALAETNNDYKQTIAYGKMGIVLAPVILTTTVASGGAAAAGWGTMGIAATGGTAAGLTTYGVNALEYNTSYTGNTAEAREQNFQDSLVNGATTGIGIGQMKYIGNMANNLGTTARTGIRLTTTVAADTAVGTAAEGLTTGDVTTAGLISNMVMSGVGNAIGAKSLGKKQPTTIPQGAKSTLDIATNDGAKTPGGKLSETKLDKVKVEVKDELHSGATPERVAQTYKEADKLQAVNRQQGREVKHIIEQGAGFETHSKLRTATKEGSQDIIDQININEAKTSSAILAEKNAGALAPHDAATLESHLVNNLNTADEVELFMTQLKERVGVNENGKMFKYEVQGKDHAADLMAKADSKLQKLRAKEADLATAKQNVEAFMSDKTKGITPEQHNQVIDYIDKISEEADLFALEISIRDKKMTGAQKKALADAIKNKKAEIKQAQKESPVKELPPEKTVPEPKDETSEPEFITPQEGEAIIISGEGAEIIAHNDTIKPEPVQKPAEVKPDAKAEIEVKPAAEEIHVISKSEAPSAEHYVSDYASMDDDVLLESYNRVNRDWINAEKRHNLSPEQSANLRDKRNLLKAEVESRTHLEVEFDSSGNVKFKKPVETAPEVKPTAESSEIKTPATQETTELITIDNIKSTLEENGVHFDSTKNKYKISEDRLKSIKEALSEKLQGDESAIQKAMDKIQSTLKEEDITNIQKMLNSCNGEYSLLLKENPDEFFLLYSNLKNSKFFKYGPISDAEWHAAFNTLDKNVPLSDVSALMRYKGTGYKNINAAMTDSVKNGTPIPEYMQKEIDAVERCIASQSVKEPFTVYRVDGPELLDQVMVDIDGKNMTLSDAIKNCNNEDEKIALINNLNSNKYSVTNDRFTSTSMFKQSNVGTNDKNMLVWELEVQPETQGVYVEGLNYTGKLSNEREFLIQKNAHIEITGAEYGADGKLHLKGKISTSNKASNVTNNPTTKSASASVERGVEYTPDNVDNPNLKPKDEINQPNKFGTVENPDYIAMKSAKTPEDLQAALKIVESLPDSNGLKISLKLELENKLKALGITETPKIQLTSIEDLYKKIETDTVNSKPRFTKDEQLQIKELCKENPTLVEKLLNDTIVDEFGNTVPRYPTCYMVTWATKAFKENPEIFTKLYDMKAINMNGNKISRFNNYDLERAFRAYNKNPEYISKLLLETTDYNGLKLYKYSGYALEQISKKHIPLDNLDPAYAKADKALDSTEMPISEDSASYEFLQFLDLTNHEAYKQVIDPNITPTLDNAKVFKKDFEKLKKTEAMSDFIKNFPDNPKSDMLYKKYLDSEFPSTSEPHLLKIKDKCMKINEKYGTKIILPTDLKEANECLKLIDQELNNFKTQSNSKAKLPPVIDFLSSKAQFVISAEGFSEIASGAVNMKGMSADAIRKTFKHEIMHSNDLRNLMEFPNGIKKSQNGQLNIKECKYYDDLKNIGLSDERIDYAYTNPMEFIAVASEGDLSKCSQELRKALIDFGMPEWMFNTKQPYTAVNAEGYKHLDVEFDSSGDVKLRNKSQKSEINNNKPESIISSDNDVEIVAVESPSGQKIDINPTSGGIEIATLGKTPAEKTIDNIALKHPELKENLEDIVTNSKRELFPADVVEISKYLQKYPEYANEITTVCKNNPNIKFGRNLSGQVTNDLEIFTEILKQNQEYKKEITEFLQVQRRGIYDSTNPCDTLQDYVKLLRSNPEQKALIAKLAQNHNFDVLDIDTCLNMCKGNKQKADDILNLSSKQYPLKSIVKKMQTIEKYPQLRDNILSDLPTYQLIDNNPTVTPETYNKRTRILNNINKDFPQELKTLRTTLGDDFFKKVKWDEIIPQNATKQEIKIILDDLNDSSKFFARLSRNELEYGKNIQWAHQINNASKNAQTKINSGASFQEVIGGIAEDYRAIDVASTYESNVRPNLRRQWSGVYRGNVEYGHPRTDFRKGGEGYGKYYYDKFEKVANIKRESPYPDVELTQIKILEGTEQGLMEHPTSKTINSSMRHMNDKYEELKPLFEKVNSGQKLSQAEINFAHEKISEIYYLMANSMPWGRGSNGISDVFMRSSYKSLGIDQPALKRNVSLDLDAFCVNMDEFKAKWLTFFEKPVV